MKEFRYEGEHAREVSMPVGGIGAGCVGLAGNGALTDWEITNRPGKGKINPFTHFAVKAERGGETAALVLQGDHLKDLSGQYALCKFDHYGYGYGPDAGTMAGFPHFEKSAFVAAFPFARVEFSDARFPGSPRLHAFSSFIPMEEDDSSLPCAFFEIEIENTADETITYTAAFTLGTLFDKSVHEVAAAGGARALTITSGENQLCAITDADDASIQTHWFRGGWFDGATMYWNQFTQPGFLPARGYDTPGADRGTLEARFTLAPGQTGRARFLLSWYYPTQVNDWDEGNMTWKNHYATRFSSALDAGLYAMRHWARLEGATARFRDALYETTMPEKALEAAAASLSVLVTPVSLRLEDGSYYGWEGINERGGSCEGTCQHVWNYAYALPYLFPALERSVRENEFQHSQHADGRLSFRMRLPAGRGFWWKMPCVDGQMGAVMQVYRDWKLSGDSDWLRRMWPGAKRALEFAWLDNDVKWDADKDGVLDGWQHHTLDMELFGPNAWLQGFYLGALRAAAEMAREVGDDAAEYERLFARGKAFLNDELFNGEYYYHKVDLTDRAQLERYANLGDWGTRALDYY
ncbi:MAG: GH116 family glycosyl-hydrolase, partial [Christensenellales bacterium]